MQIERGKSRSVLTSRRIGMKITTAKSTLRRFGITI
jgi:hypothetical protein